VQFLPQDLELVGVLRALVVLQPRGAVGPAAPRSNYEESMKTTLEWYTDLSPSVLDEAARFYSWESARRPE
jgi:hypothetical protein